MKQDIRNTILERIKIKQYISSKEIKDLYKVSLMTVNRWLEILDKEGTITKIYGGAIARNIPHSSTITYSSQNITAKRNIARYAVSLFIHPEHTYFLEAGGTIYEMLPFIQEKHITIITNSIHIIYSINQYIPEINVLCVGGIVRPQSMSIVGEVAELTLNNFRAHTSFLACKAISEEGVFDSDLFESVIKRKMISQSERVVLLADSTKINSTSAELVARFEHIDDLVTDTMPPENMLKIFEKNQVNVHIAPKDF